MDKGGNTFVLCKWKQKGMVVILIPDNIEFKPQNIKHNKGHFLMLKATVYQQKREESLYT